MAANYTGSNSDDSGTGAQSDRNEHTEHEEAETAAEAISSNSAEESALTTAGAALGAALGALGSSAAVGAGLGSSVAASVTALEDFADAVPQEGRSHPPDAARGVLSGTAEGTSRPLRQRVVIRQREVKRSWYRRKVRLLQVGVVLAVLVGLGVAGWLLAPVVIKRVAIPGLDWAQRTFTKVELALLIIAILAVGQACFFPGGPLIWLAGIVFRYGWGALIVTLGTGIGAAFAFALGRFFFKRRFQAWIVGRPKVQLVVSYAERGGWRERTQTVFLLRYSPIPYTLLCFGLAATSLPFGPYMLGTVLQQIPDTFAGLYTGIVLQDLSDYLSGKQVPSTVQIITNVLGFTCTFIVVVGATIYCRKMLKRLEVEEADHVRRQRQLSLGPLERTGSQAMRPVHEGSLAVGRSQLGAVGLIGRSPDTLEVTSTEETSRLS